jgi:histidinol-phosphate aminotransferase
MWEGKMALHLNRRQWLKTSAFAAAGLIAGSNFASCKRDAASPRASAGGEDLIWLKSNESPYGVSESTQQVIINSLDRSNRYPHRRYSALKELIAERENISPDNIFLGAGSTEIMTTLIHLYGIRGDTLVADPTYFDFVWYADKARCTLRSVKLNENFEHDLQAMEQYITPDTGLIYICNPNNPTGSITPGDKLYAFCERASRKAVVVVDEAYHEYVDDESYTTMLDFVRTGRNVVVTRTFSKIFGMAGLRIGYGMARSDIVEELDRVSRNFAPVAWLSLKAAISSYQNIEFIEYVKRKNREVKSYLYKELNRLGLDFIPSHTNFVLFKVSHDALEMAEEFEKRKVVIRPIQFYGDNWIRVSLGTLDEIRAFVSVLSELV